MTHRTSLRTALFLGAAGAALCGGALSAAPTEITVQLKLDPKGAESARVGYFPVQVGLTPDKPAGIKKEPTYAGKPKYATVKIGNADRPTYVALDEPEGGDWKIYVDVNRNGDLTDDGSTGWSKKQEQPLAQGGTRTLYGPDSFTLQGAWKDSDGQVVTAPYGINFYRFSNQPYLLSYRQAARTGTLTLGGKEHKVVLVENDADGVFSKPLADPKKPSGRPIWLLVDLNGDGRFADDQQPEMYDIRVPFKLAGEAYEPVLSADGSTLKLVPTTKETFDLIQRRKPLLAAGAPAPDFTAEAWGGGNVSLSQFKGKIVLLDFWATWCGPCRLSMPHLEQVSKAVKDQGVVTLAVAVADKKEDYEKWVPEHRDRYSFSFAYDPVGQSGPGIHQRLYNVTGIPTTYVIDREGKVAAAIVGYREGDTRIEEALRKLGVDVK